MENKKEYNDGKALLNEADIKIKGSCFSNLCKSLNDRKLECLPLYEKAGVLFKIAGAWEDAAKCYFDCAEISQRNNDDAVGFYEEAAACYEKFDKKSNFIIKKNNLKYCIF